MLCFYHRWDFYGSVRVAQNHRSGRKMSTVPTSQLELNTMFHQLPGPYHVVSLALAANREPACLTHEVKTKRPA